MDSSPVTGVRHRLAGFLTGEFEFAGSSPTLLFSGFETFQHSDDFFHRRRIGSRFSLFDPVERFGTNAGAARQFGLRQTDTSAAADQLASQRSPRVRHGRNVASGIRCR